MSSKDQYKQYTIRLKKEAKHLNSEVEHLRRLTSMLKNQNNILRNPKVNPSYSWNKNKFIVGFCIGLLLALMICTLII